VSYLSLGLTAALWGVFTASAASKVRSGAAYRAFADSLRPLLPVRLMGPAAAAVTAAETVIVLGLTWSLVAVTAGWAGARAGAGLVLVLAGLLMTALTSGVVLAVARRTQVRCACFGVAERPLGPRHIVRNSILLAGSLAALLSLAFGQAQPPSVGGAAVAVAAGLVGALVLIRLDDLIDLFQPISV